MLAWLVWGSPGWWWFALAVGLAAGGALVWGYVRAPGRARLRLIAAALKTLGILALLICLLEPLASSTRPRPGANLFVLLADESQSMQVRDSGAAQSRGERVASQFDEHAPWQQRLRQDFDVRRYAFAERLRALERGDGLTFQGSQSALCTALGTLAKRFQGRPLAGILVSTDGNATDLATAASDWSGLPPIYPVLPDGGPPAKDISVQAVSVTQTKFEQSPVTIRAELSSAGYHGRKLLVELLDSSGKQLQQQTVEASDDEARAVRFRLRPERPGVSFYQVRAAAESERAQFEHPEQSTEATLANNTKLVTVDRPAGPYRVLYVAGRPNWEFAFLRRAIAEDREVELVGLLRIAKREPKFTFLGRPADAANPLYRGFEDRNADETEQYDQPVLVRVGTRDPSELRDGFPKTAEELYAYHGVILDDVEAGFFSADQLLLLQRFVGTRGGGLLMLGGAESFQQGGYARTPVGEMLPVYLDRAAAPSPAAHYRWMFSREGWLEPWVRLRETEDEEHERLRHMPVFEILNGAREIKPGATLLAAVADDQGAKQPALVSQPFGKGRTAALLVGDWWRWSLKRPVREKNDLATAWRQTVRWLVADVPRRVELLAASKPAAAAGQVELRVDVHDPEYQPLDNAAVELSVTAPDGKKLQLRAEPDAASADAYVANYVPRQPGAYRAEAVARAADGSEIGRRESGWSCEPAAEEFRRLAPNLELLKRVARETGGEPIGPGALEAFAASLPHRKVPVSEPWVWPLWHQSLVFLLAVACLAGEWGLRRWKGLP